MYVKRMTSVRVRGRWALAATCLVAVVLAAVPTAATEHRDNNGLSGARPGSSLQVAVDGKWSSFSLGKKGSLSAPITFRSPRPVALRVTDALCRGDRLAVIEGSTVIGRASRVRVDHGCNQSPRIQIPTQAFDSATYSHGVFLLAAGSHHIRLRMIVSPFGGGTVYLSVVGVSMIQTDGTESILGTLGHDSVWAAGGADRVTTLSGPDLVFAGPGDDSARAGLGGDWVEGEAANDMLAGGPGDDRVVGGPGTDAVIGESGSDAVVGGAGIDVLSGMAGSDRLDSVDGVGGNDLVVGGAGVDVCWVDASDHVRGCEEVRQFSPVTTLRPSVYDGAISRLQAQAQDFMRAAQ
jgi:Ca2+-binding RTX toxin-like protein